jgi:hypothetical protein
MRALRLNDGAVNVAGAKLGAALQRVSDVLQEGVTPIDSNRPGSGENSVKLGISQVNGRWHYALSFR